MAERSSELSDETTARTGETDAIATKSDTSDNVYLENRDDDDYASAGETEADADETSEETEQLRAQIEETRSSLGETIDAIQEKLSISNITDQVKGEVSEHITSALQTAKDSVYDATIGKVGNIMSYVEKGFNEIGGTQIGLAAKKNPLAISLIGLGFGMLLINGYSKKRTSYRYESDYDYDFEGENDYEPRELSSSRDTDYSSKRTSQSKGRNISGQVSKTAGQAYKGVSNYAGQAYEGVSDYAGQAYEGVSGAASKVGGSVSDAAGKVSDSVSGAASQAYKQIGNVGSKAKDVAGSAQDQYEHYMEENPLAVGAVALAIGAAVGLSIPSTRVENHLMGEAREQLVAKASDTAREAIDKVQQVAGEVKQTVQEKVGEVTQTVQDKVQDAANQAK